MKQIIKVLPNTNMFFIANEKPNILTARSQDHKEKLISKSVFDEEKEKRPTIFKE
jgi:hypothetical protein